MHVLKMTTSSCMLGQDNHVGYDGTCARVIYSGSYDRRRSLVGPWLFRLTAAEPTADACAPIYAAGGPLRPSPRPVTSAVQLFQLLGVLLQQWLPGRWNFLIITLPKYSHLLKSFQTAGLAEYESASTNKIALSSSSF